MAFHMRIIIIFIVISSSATEKVKNLTGTEGGSITLPDPVVKEGFLSFGKKTVAVLIEKTIKIYEDKVLWDKSTGLFTITGLQRSDSGIYVIDSRTGIASTTTYQLTVYEPVPPPAVKSLSVSTESCILLCWVEKAEGTTLLWYKDEEIVNQSSSTLSLPLTVLKDFNSSYRCVSANPAEEKTAPVNVSTTCSGEISTSSSNRQRWWWVRILVVVFAGPVVVYLIFTNVKKERETKRERQTERETAAPSTLH